MQTKVVAVVLELLADEDQRIRSAASATVCSLVTNMSHDRTKVAKVAREAMCQSRSVLLALQEGEREVDGESLKSLLKTYRGYNVEGDDAALCTSVASR